MSGVLRTSRGHHLRHFEFKHLRPEIQPVAQIYYTLAYRISENLKEGDQRAMALEYLLISRDAAVRAKLDELRGHI